MKLLPFILLLSLTTFGQRHFTITGHLISSSGKKIYLTDACCGPLSTDKVLHIDSMIAVNDSFSFSGSFSEYGYYSLSVDSVGGYQRFVIDTGVLSVSGNTNEIWHASISGSQQNIWLKELGKERNALISQRNEVAKRVDSISRKLSICDQATYDSLTTHLQNFVSSFVQKHPQSYAALVQVGSMLDNPSDKDWGRIVFPLFSEELKNTSEGKQTAYLLYGFHEDSFAGKPFPELKMYNLAKEMKTFAPSPGKIYLIDYWASWCVPCIEKLPELKALREQYSKKDFTIVSISIDNKYENWIRSVKKNNIPWENYSALKGIEAPDVKYFNVSAIPFMVLIGKGNKIIKVDPTIEEVKQYLDGQ